MTDRAIEAYEAKLQDSALDFKTKAQLLLEIRDQAEQFCQPPTLPAFLAKFVPIFLDILSEPPVFTSNSNEQLCRLRPLEIFHRFPGNCDSQVVEPYAGKIMAKCLELCRVDNEDNAVLCLKVIMDFCRHHTSLPAVQEKAQPFLDLILDIFDAMEQTVKDTFDGSSGAAAGVVPGSPNHTGTPGSPVTSTSQSLSDPAGEQHTTRQLTKGMQSFKVVAECPIIVVSVFQAFRSLVNKNVQAFTPRIKVALQLEAEPQRRAREEAKARGDIFTGVTKEIKLKGQGAAYGDLITAQVKTMSFLAYLLRAYQSSMQEFLEFLPDLTVRLLQDVPRAHTATRKELLVAIRHIINFNFRNIFLKVILPLLDPRTLVGDSLTADLTLRPLAYTMLADLIHHVRDSLNAEQIAKVVEVYVGHLTGEDGVEVPGTSYQTMSAKLLLNMAECMSKIEDKKEARFIMMSVLSGIANKFAAMNRAFPNAVKLAVQQQEHASGPDSIHDHYIAEADHKPDWDETDIFNAMPIKAVNPRDRATDPVTENKFLFKNLLHGLKTFFYQLRNSNPPRIREEVEEANAPVNWKELSSGFESEEVDILIKLFREGAQCFQYYAPLPNEQKDEQSAREQDPAFAASTANNTSSTKEEKDLLETFATIFHHLDPATFHEIFSSGVPSGIAFLYEQSFRHSALLHIPQFLLASEATSPAFCGMLLNFLMSKLEEVGERDTAKTSVLLRLFKLSFMAVTLFSQVNESVLLPHVRELITRSIELSVSAAEPTNYFLLLRSLFRSIGGGRFEHLYKEILPLLEMLLEVLNTQLAAAPDGGTRDLFVELSLTVPARLSHLLPHLSYLMRPLTVALRSAERANDPRSERETFRNHAAVNAGVGSAELTAQGLRTLELCVDNLTADYLDPIMQPWMDEIMGSLWRMLKPPSLQPGAPGPNGVVPYVGTGHAGAHTAVRILGKLGGRNRRFIQGPPELECKAYADDEASYDIRLVGAVANNGERAMPARLGIETAVDQLWAAPRTPAQKKSDEFYKRQAFKFIVAQARMLIGFDHLPDDFARLVRLQALDLAEKKLDAGTDLFGISDRSKSTAKRDAQQRDLLKLLRSVMFATSIEHLREDAEKFLQGVYRHFMLVELGVALGRAKHQQRAFDARSGEGPVFIETGILADAICDSLASDVKEVRETAEKGLVACLRIASTLFGREELAECLPFFGRVADACVRACYEEEWFTKSSGALGISILIDRNKMRGLSDAWVAERLSDLVRALLFVTKDMPQDLPANVRVQAREALLALVERFAASIPATTDDVAAERKQQLENKDTKLHMLAARLVAEVCHMNRHVREAAQSALRALAAGLGIPIWQLVNPVKDPLVQPIFNKPLRALPFAAQIGYVDAIDFLLDMPPECEVLHFGEELNRLLFETLALVDADDESLAPQHKLPEYRTAEAIVRLRVAGLKLLTTAIRFPGFSANANTVTAASQPNSQQQANNGAAAASTPSSSSQQQPQPQQPAYQPGTQHRARVISIFFKSLYSKNALVSGAANAGLKIVLAATQKLPKDLLQNGLRPILMNVQDPRKLSVEGLEGLRTLLQLLTNYFKVEIGTRLLDHMNHIADPATLQKVSFGLVEGRREMRVVTAIFNVFHLLPPAAGQFLPTLVERVVRLEQALRRTRCSPFRAPLVRYLNCYPGESWGYFGGAAGQGVKGRFFAQVLREEESGALRGKVVEEAVSGGFVGTFLGDGGDGKEGEEGLVAAVNALAVAEAVCAFPDTSGRRFMEVEEVRSALWRAAVRLRRERDGLPTHLRLVGVQAVDDFMKMMMVYFEANKQDLDGLFALFEAVAKGELVGSPCLFDFLYREVVSSGDVEFQRKVVLRCIEVYTAKGGAQKLRWFVVRNVMNPILANDVMRNWTALFPAGGEAGQKGTELLDKALVDAVHNKLWKPQSVADISAPSSDGGDASSAHMHGVDHSRMELLQTSAFLVKYHHPLLQDARKDLIKFGWNYIRLEDHIDKYAAYCLIAYFIHHYETPPKIAMQVYAALLRAHQTEGRNLVMQSLEVLEPVLKKRLGGPDGRQSVWARLPRKILSEEVGNVPQLTSVYHFLVRHAELFYEAREPLAGIVIQTINKVAGLPASGTETRRLALGLFGLVLKWEERTVRERGALSEGVEGKRKTLAVAGPGSRLLLVKYMAQFVATVQERFPVGGGERKGKEVLLQRPGSSSGGSGGSGGHHAGLNAPTETVTRALELMRKLLSAPYWDDLEIEPMFPKVTEQILCSDHKPEEKIDVWTTRVVNTIQIVKVLLVSRSPEWCLGRLGQLQKLLGKVLRADNPEIQDALHNGSEGEKGMVPRLPPMLEYILSAIPTTMPEEELPDADDPNEEFINFLQQTAGDQLANGSHMAGINILWIMAKRKPEDIDQHIPALLKTLQTKLAKDHLAQPMLGQAAGGQQAQASNVDPEITNSLIVKVMDMLSTRISALGDQRRPYLSVLASLVERSQNTAVCERILQQVEGWVFAPTEPVPTLKEKTAVLQKMLLFEHRADPTLYHRFMALVIRIYEDGKITRSELAVRMEHAFLVGLRSPDVEMRGRFVGIFDKALSRSTSARFFKLISEQQWDVLGDSFWLSQILQQMFGAVELGASVRLDVEEDFTCLAPSRVFATYAADGRLGDVMVDDGVEALVAGERQFIGEVGTVKARDVLLPLADLQHTDSQLAHDLWVAYFPMCWSTLSKDDRSDIEQGLVALLTKDFHQRQVDKRPNCVATLLEGIARAKPVCKFPPHVMKYLAKSYNAWYTAATSLEDMAIKPAVDNANVRESNLDALVEVYAALEEGDLFYGTWRRRAQFVETNSALSYEQNGIWDKAQNMYEQAQIKARTGSLPFSQGEYMLWEDQWVMCAQKLQQWDILGDFAKHENINDLYLEAMWRNFEAWNQTETRDQLDSIIKAVSDAPTPRRMFFQAFMSLLKLHTKSENIVEFNRVCDENIYLSIKNWHKLPRLITNAHIGLLENFQQLVELHDASVICQSLSQTNANNLDVKSQELKVLLSTWRDRLPNLWDDINAWQDLVTWRQHIFQLINGTYLGLLNQPAGNNATGNSFAYRGYHETAWIINRFAHVARKHQMPDVCITQLSKIYTLPNIEIQEAFLKLREQAKCHYQNRAELTSGLDVINNTNLNYFGQQQKAEFYTLKGMFLSKLNQKEEAHDAFGTALFFDIKLPKAWAEWGRYSDYLFKEDPTNIELASNSLSCYLEAAGQYRSSKSRKLLSRILWLLSLDDAEGTLAKGFLNFKGDQPWWYWVTFIPQLLSNLSRTEGEANIAHQILASLAKTYPQALHFQLRTSHEDMQVIRRSQAQKEQRERAQRAQKQAQGGEVKQETPDRPGSAGAAGASRPGTAAGGEAAAAATQTNGNVEGTPKQEDASAAAATTNEEAKPAEAPKPKKPWEHTEALTITLRTAFPLLYASMEAMTEQIMKHFKCQPDEDAFRLVVALLNDAIGYVGKAPHMYSQEAKLPSQTEANIQRFADSVLPAHLRKAFEADFVTKKPSMVEYIEKCRKWRDRLAEKLDRKPQTFHLAGTTHLSDFRFIWFDEVEVPGQYLQHKDKNQDFVRIERFLPTVEVVRGVSAAHRRLKIRGHDGSVHAFAVQHPAPRHARREERILQLFRILNSTLSKKKESRRRNLQFHLPVIVPLGPPVRMVQEDTPYISLQAIWEDYCRRNEVDKDEPITFFMQKLKHLGPQKQEQLVQYRMESLHHVQESIAPNDIVRSYFAATHPTFDAFWLFRRQFSYQLAALSYMTFTMHMTSRHPSKMNIAGATGNMYGTDLLPYMSPAKPYFQNPEAVNIRLTPNLQVLMGPIHTEGIFTCAMMAIARCLTSDSSYTTAGSNSASGTPAQAGGANGNAANGQQQQTNGMHEGTNCELEHHLSIFIRDEMAYWYTTSHRTSIKEHELRENVQRNSDVIVNKALYLAKEPQAGNLPANQSVLDLGSAEERRKELRETVQRNSDAVVSRALYLAKAPRASDLPAKWSVLGFMGKITAPEQLAQTKLLSMLLWVQKGAERRERGVKRSVDGEEKKDKTDGDSKRKGETVKNSEYPWYPWLWRNMESKRLAQMRLRWMPWL